MFHPKIVNQLKLNYNKLQDKTIDEIYINQPSDNPAFQEDNFDKNRYCNITPQVETLVKINNNKYINANYIKLLNHKYIATQAPLPKTFNEFYEMLYYQSSRVLMLTQLNEPFKQQNQQIKIKHKADKYWPESDQCMELEDFYVYNKSEQTLFNDLSLKQLVMGLKIDFCENKQDFINCCQLINKTKNVFNIQNMKLADQLMSAHPKQNYKLSISNYTKQTCGRAASVNQYKMVYETLKQHRQQIYKLQSKHLSTISDNSDSYEPQVVQLLDQTKPSTQIQNKTSDTTSTAEFNKSMDYTDDLLSPKPMQKLQTDYIHHQNNIEQISQQQGSKLNDSKIYLLKQVIHYHYMSWMDTLSPSNINSFHQMVGLCLKYKSMQQQENDLITVHCSAGIGRTGFFIICCYYYQLVEIENKKLYSTSQDLYQQIVKQNGSYYNINSINQLFHRQCMLQNLIDENLILEVDEVIFKIRTERDGQMVQTVEQYVGIFLYIVFLSCLQAFKK